MKWIVAITVSLVLNLLLIFRGRGSLPATLLPMITSILIGLILLIASAIFFMIGTRRKSLYNRNLAPWSHAIALIIFSTLLSVPIGHRLLAGDMRRAKTFCETLIPRLEGIKSQTGMYPQEIGEVLGGQIVPSHLPFWNYQSYGTNFSFYISNSGEIGGSIAYVSRTKTWYGLH